MTWITRFIPLTLGLFKKNNRRLVKNKDSLAWINFGENDFVTQNNHFLVFAGTVVNI
jgi:hypothetical protein